MFWPLINPTSNTLGLLQWDSISPANNQHPHTTNGHTLSICFISYISLFTQTGFTLQTVSHKYSKNTYKTRRLGVGTIALQKGWSFSHVSTNWKAAIAQLITAVSKSAKWQRKMSLRLMTPSFCCKIQMTQAELEGGINLLFQHYKTNNMQTLNQSFDSN